MTTTNDPQDFDILDLIKNATLLDPEQIEMGYNQRAAHLLNKMIEIADLKVRAYQLHNTLPYSQERADKGNELHRQWRCMIRAIDHLPGIELAIITASNAAIRQTFGANQMAPGYQQRLRAYDIQADTDRYSRHMNVIVGYLRGAGYEIEDLLPSN